MLYFVSGQTGTITTANDLLQLTHSATEIAVLHRMWVEQISHAGDADNEMYDLILWRIVGGTGGSGGSVPNTYPKSIGPGGAGNFSAATARVGATTSFTGGTAQILRITRFYGPFGWEHIWEPHERPVIQPNVSIYTLLKLITAPSQGTVFNVGCVFEELGG